MTRERPDLSPEGRAATVRRHSVLAALRGPERDWEDVYDEDGSWLGRVPPVEVSDEDVAGAFERVAAVVSIAAEHPAVERLLREGTYAADDGPAVLQTAHLSYSDEEDRVAVELGLGRTRERVASIPGSLLRAAEG